MLGSPTEAVVELDHESHNTESETVAAAHALCTINEITVTTSSRPVGLERSRRLRSGHRIDRLVLPATDDFCRLIDEKSHARTHARLAGALRQDEEASVIDE